MSDGLARQGFDIDLRDGEAHEDALVHTFLQDKVEVKADFKAARTGNVFIEYQQKGRPSGIAITEAHYWAIHVVGNGWAIIPTERLKALARAAYNDPALRVKGGDHNLYDGVLIPIDWLLQTWRAA